MIFCDIPNFEHRSLVMKRIKPAKFLLPAAFLFVLGAGNIYVGQYKGSQYSQVVSELSELQPTPGLINASPLVRIKFARATADRHYERLNQARGRRNFYRMVTVGGGAFLVFSLILGIFGITVVFKNKSPESSAI